MGASTSKIEEDRALQLCSERKKFVKQALDGRCSLAASHVTYILSLRSVGVALQKFVEPDAPTESSLCTSTSATPEPLALTEKSPSQFSFHSPTLSHRMDAAETFSPSPPPFSGRFQVNHMKFWGSFSKTVQKKPSLPVMGTVTSSSAPQNTTLSPKELPEGSSFEDDHMAHGNEPWDFFFQSSENDFHVQGGVRVKQQLENADDIRQFREEEGVPKLENADDIRRFREDDNFSLSSREESCESEDEFDEPSADTLVRRFENLNRAPEHVEAGISSAMPASKSVASETELLNRKKSYSPDLSPSRATPLAASVPIGANSILVEEDVAENKVAPEDFPKTMKYIEGLFIKASESGKEVPRMLEANKLHFRPVVPQTKGDTVASTILKACFSCGEDPSSVPEEPAQTTMKYLTWPASSRSSSSRMLNGLNSKDDTEDPNNDVCENFCMNSGSHASTLDRLYAWERKLHDEVKGSKIVRRRYDMKCRTLRELESSGESSYKIDKTRATIKDLHSRIRVAIHRIDHISSKIEELRDTELQPQLEELMKGLSDMWKEMSKYHKLQYNAISVVHSNSSTRISIHSESRRQITVRLENELSSLSSSFNKWIGAQKYYLQAIDGWLLKCVSLPQISSKKKNRGQLSSWKEYGPPIYTASGVWLEKLAALPTKDVVDSIKGLAAETSGFLPRHEKDQVKSMQSNISNSGILRDEISEDWTIGFDHFRSSLVGFLGQLNNFAKSSAGMYEDIEKEIKKAKDNYKEWNKHVNARSKQTLNGENIAGVKGKGEIA